jgi:copper oxidase (laccase) domain-containing protein
MFVDFRTRGISQGARKLTRTPTLIKKIKPYIACYAFKQLHKKQLKKNKEKEEANLHQHDAIIMQKLGFTVYKNKQ